MITAKELMDRFSKTSCRGRKVKCDETGEVWDNVCQCAKELGISVATLHRHVLARAAGKNSSLSGIHFSLIDK